MTKVNYLSAEGLEKLKQELQYLKTERRREVAARIEAAKALGDLSENAEYHEAKDEMVLVENRIIELEEILKNVAVIEEETGKEGVIRVGSIVDVDVNGKHKTYMIVGSNEADPVGGKVSNESPIGSALLGSKAGDAVDVKTPTGTVTYQVTSVK